MYFSPLLRGDQYFSNVKLNHPDGYIKSPRDGIYDTPDNFA